MKMYHLPPAEIQDVRSIIDLGCNIGLTTAHYAALYPQAEITAVELDHETADEARRNVARWPCRCRVLTAAVWDRPGVLEYVLSRGDEDGAHVIPQGVAQETRTSRAILMDDLVGDSIVDFVKFDIEGAEREVLQGDAAWAAHVRSMKVEVHGDYSVRDCEADLRRLGFNVRVDRRHPACVVAVRALGYPVTGGRC
jgi:FkbM family methyltransferase